MLHAGIFIGVLLVSPTVAAAQAPCTTDARRIVDEIYRHMLERAPDPGSATHVAQLAGGSASVRDLVRLFAKSPEHMQRFFPPGQARDEREQAVGTLYRHLLGRQPDPAGARAFAEVAVTRGVDAVIDEILASPEYRDAFGDTGVPGSGGLRYCASERAEQSPAAGRNGEMRFRGMDRNNDGMIARSEWRGSAESFRAHDWDEWHGSLEAFDALDRNDDTVLSRAELGGNAGRRRDSFTNLDVNRNGTISRDEWHWSRRSFDQQDVNRDGVLTRREFNGGGVPTSGRD